MGEIIQLLLNTEQANVAMQNIASYIIYISPGIISIYLYNFFDAKKTKGTQAFLIKSFAISYLYNLFLQVIFQKICDFKAKVQKDKIIYNIVLIIVAIVIPYIAHKFINSKVFAYICSLFGISTSVTDVPFELLEDEDEKYTCLKVFIKDEPYVYIGFIQEYEYENERDKFLILSAFRKYIINEKKREKLIEGHKAEEYNEKVFIKFSNIKYIEKLGQDRAMKEIYNTNKL